MKIEFIKVLRKTKKSLRSVGVHGSSSNPIANITVLCPNIRVFTLQRQRGPSWSDRDVLSIEVPV